mgnify:FL=1|jgi:hypothetical protein|tara:strand:+ start:168 stop:776 length:609 start_codon:yes stop_codon:yes gene_type:complete
MTDSALLKRIVKQAEGLLKKVTTDKRTRGTVPIDAYRERCLDHIDRVNNLTVYTHDEIEWAKMRIFKVYFTLQSYDGPERSTEALVPPLYEDQEVNIDSVEPLVDDAVVSAYQKNQHAGGMGFSHSRGMTLSEGVGKPANHYWNPVLAAKKSPITYLDPSTIEYKHKETTQEWRDRMAAEKADILWREDSDLKGVTSNGEDE